ncbi:spore germination protein [Clostridium oceanicum]|uniref:Spore germination protein n=1 Tax=Clostridium oceanicum TaxID=1543 RepID=A0ABN1JUP8_9CLOT
MNYKYLDYIKDKLKNNFDIVYRKLNHKNTNLCMIFVSNLCDSKFISNYIIYPIIKDENFSYTIESLQENIISANSVGIVKDKDDAIMHILSGDVVILSDSSKEVMYIEAKGFVKRNVSIPSTESVIKGPKESFTEVLMDNISLIRRKLKNPNLKVENFTIGNTTNTLVALCYLEGTAPQKLVDDIKNKIQNINIDVTLESNSIEEKLSYNKSFFDTTSTSEKPDVISSKIIEGRVALIIDGSPFVITVPHFFIENIQMADDYYTKKSFANLNRFIRWIALFICLFLPGMYLAITTHHFPLIPYVFVFRLAKSRAGVPFPTIIEVLLMTFFFQLVREAGLRLPQPIGQSMSIVGALILGDAAVGAGLASQTTMVIVGITSISTFLVPKFYNAVAMWSIVFSITSAFGGLPAFYLTFCVFLSHISSLESCGYPYLYPIGTSNKINAKDILSRNDLESSNDPIPSDNNNNK